MRPSWMLRPRVTTRSSRNTSRAPSSPMKRYAPPSMPPRREGRWCRSCALRRPPRRARRWCSTASCDTSRHPSERTLHRHRCEGQRGRHRLRPRRQVVRARLQDDGGHLRQGLVLQGAARHDARRQPPDHRAAGTGGTLRAARSTQRQSHHHRDRGRLPGTSASSPSWLIPKPATRSASRTRRCSCHRCPGRQRAPPRRSSLGPRVTKTRS